MPDVSRMCRGRPQIGFVFDDSDFVVACCSRRAGKSTGGRRKILRKLLAKPESLTFYITLTRQSAKRLMWDPLKADLWNLRIPYEANETELSLTLPSNGSRVWLAGANDGAQIDRLRGHAPDLALIDEPQSMRERVLRPLVQDVLIPSMLDRRGQICLTGTPGPVPDGYFYEACHSEGWSRHHWTMLDNTTWSREYVEEFLARTRKHMGWSEDHPTYRREFLGEWVWDKDILVLSAFNPEVHLWAA